MPHPTINRIWEHVRAVRVNREDYVVLTASDGAAQGMSTSQPASIRRLPKNQSSGSTANLEAEFYEVLAASTRLKGSGLQFTSSSDDFGFIKFIQLAAKGRI